jgi:hypothetical protein
MRCLPGACCLAVCAVLGSGAPVRGAFHDWEIKEIFTSADGMVQFIELFTTSPSEHFIQGHPLTVTNDGGVPTTVTFPSNLPSPPSTANRHFLVSTAGFGALAGGVTPNYAILPPNFININAATIKIDFAHFGVGPADSVTFSGALLPKDGVNSLTDSNTTVGGADSLGVTVNSPTNFAGAAGSVNVGGPSFAAGDFNESGMVTGADLNTNWRTGYAMQGAAVDHSDGDADDDNDVDGADFLIWQQDLEAAVVAAGGGVPEPAAGLLAGLATLTLATARRRAV